MTENEGPTDATSADLAGRWFTEGEHVAKVVGRIAGTQEPTYYYAEYGTDEPLYGRLLTLGDLARVRFYPSQSDAKAAVRQAGE